MRKWVAAVAILAPLAAHAGNWPQFRGPNASGVAEGAKIPREWNVEKSSNIRWKTPIPGISVSSPVVWGDRVFVTTAISSDPSATLRPGIYRDVEPAKDITKHTWKVYCLERKSGRVLWEVISHVGIPKTKRHPKSSQASCTPATDGKHVVVSFGSEGLYCYDFQGKLLWKQDLGVLNAGWFYDPDYEWGVASSPIIWRDRVIVQCDIQANSFIAAFALEGGKSLWRTAREELPSWGTPTIYEGPKRVELITQATKFIRGYDPMTGRELWRLGPNSEVTAPTPIVAHDLIFVTNGYRVIQPIYAIRPGGSGDISLKQGQESNVSVAWSKTQGGPYIPTPIVYGDFLYVCSNNGILACYKARTGERLYQERLGKGGAYSASPVASGGVLYFTSEDGDVHVVRAGPKYDLLATNSVGEVCIATPAISDDALILRTMRHVLAIGEKGAR